jgi:hypothetical protein
LQVNAALTRRLKQTQLDDEGSTNGSVIPHNREQTTEQTTENPQPPEPRAPRSCDSSIKSKRLPTSEAAIRIANLFNRKLTTEWSDKEIRAFKKLKINPEDMALIEAYYESERKKPSGIHRRDIKTFLNNYAGELDRATAYSHEQAKPNQSTPRTRSGAANTANESVIYSY